MSLAYRRHDIAGFVWSLLETHLPGQKESWDGISEDNRRGIDTVFWTEVGLIGCEISGGKAEESICIEKIGQ